LICPERDVDDLARVLADVNRGDFDVLTLKNQASHLVLRKLQQTIKQLQADDLLLVYYSGHGKPNRNNILHLTTVDTVISELESTAIPIHRVYDIIATGKAKKIIIILDCCFSGAAGQGFRGNINDGLQQLNNCNSRGTYLVTASTEFSTLENANDEKLEIYHLPRRVMGVHFWDVSVSSLMLKTMVYTFGKIKVKTSDISIIIH
jgi:uncharacterized caspase-like protein